VAIFPYGDESTFTYGSFQIDLSLHSGYAIHQEMISIAPFHFSVLSLSIVLVGILAGKMPTKSGYVCHIRKDSTCINWLRRPDCDWGHILAMLNSFGKKYENAM